ncbi:MAG: hypothetical protein ACP5U1_05025 [Desulfomonilaceae bacterium]
MINKRQEKLLWVAVISVVLVPLIIPLGHVLVDILKSPTIWHESDNAGIELNTISALHGHQLLGVGSRFEWNHPGPIYFYLMAPAYALSGRNASGLSTAATIIALLATIGTLIVARVGCKDSSQTLACLSGILLAFYLWLIPLNSVWNPHVLYVPFVLFLLLCSLLCMGKTWALPGTVFVGSFLIQTHVGTAPCVLALFGGCLIVCFTRGLRTRLGFTCVVEGNSKFWLLFSLVILILVWFAPVLEELTHSPGNLTKLYHFFARRQDNHNLLEAVAAFSFQISWLGLLFPDDTGGLMSGRELQVISIAVAATQFVSLVFVYRINILKRQYLNAAIAGTTFIGSFLGIVSIITIKGPIYGYLISWMSGFGLTAYAVTLSALVDGFIGYARNFYHEAVGSRFSAGVAIILIVGCVSTVLRGLSDLPQRLAAPFEPRCSSAEERKIKELSECLLSYIAKQKIARPLILWDHDRWPTGIGVILQLAKSKRAFGQEGLFGDDYAVNGKEDAVIVIKGHVETVKSGYKLICSHAMPIKPNHDQFYGDSFIYIKVFP